MDLLTPDEARVLGVLIEKQMTTPDQYPLSLNAIVAGSNQKNNRAPVIEMSDDAAHTAVESLREKGVAVRVEQSGARVSYYATTGALDESLLFYLRARGLSKKEAQALLIQAFVGEAIESIVNDNLRELAISAAQRWLAARG